MALAQRCGLTMRPPVFDPAWSAEVQALWRHDVQEIWDPRIARYIWNQYHNQLEMYGVLAESQRALDILDVGCAQATLALLLAERGHRVCAVDIRQSFLDYACSRYSHGDIRFVCANALELELDRRFDLIFANQIIEHLVYPERLLRRLAALLKPAGRLVVTTPNGEYLKNPLPSYRQLGDPARWEERQHSADGDGHFFAYHADELVSLFSACGYADVSHRFFETPLISGHMKVRYLHRWLPYAWLRAGDRALLAVPALARRFGHQLLVTGVAPRSGFHDAG